MEAIGFSGGIWVFWNTSVGVISILSTHPQFMHYQVDRQGGGSWCLIAMYDSPKDHLRHKLFLGLSALHVSPNTH